MSKSKKNNTSITPESRKEMPSRGKGAKTLILDAMREKSVLELSEDSTRCDAEKAFFGFLAEAAFNPTPDTATIANTCLATLSKKGWPDVKAIDPVVEFDFDKDATSDVQAKQIMTAISNGQISPSIGVSLLTAMSSVMKIVEVTELEERIKALEAADE